MNENHYPSSYEKPAIESSNDVAGLLTFKGPGKGKGKGVKGGGNHS